jgi:hypothetical protein
MTYPDKPSAPREFEGGLENELGGPNAVRVSFQILSKGPSLTEISRQKLLAMSEWEAQQNCK